MCPFNSGFSLSNGDDSFYLDTRYYEVDDKGNLTLVTSNETDINSTYTSVSHGVYLRNAHGQEILMKPENITWRTLGGSIDLYFFDGPTQPEVTKQYVAGAIGLPAMQQYFAFGYHQCRKSNPFSCMNSLTQGRLGLCQLERR